jgi:predicted amidophosphoribosyltransferase
VIIKCPECGKPYPDSHGSMCKICASKLPKTEVKIQEKVEEVKKVVTKTIEQKDKEDGFLNVSMLSYSGTSKEDRTSASFDSISGETSMREKSKVLDVCPDCEMPNGILAPFCSECGKMLVISSKSKLDSYPINEIKGILPDQITKLKKEGIDSTIKLLGKGHKPDLRKSLANRTGISEMIISRFVNQADLMRIDGVDPNYANLLDNIGISSIITMSKKTVKDIQMLISQKKLILQGRNIIIFPDEKLIKKWIEDLKTLEKFTG